MLSELDSPLNSRRSEAQRRAKVFSRGREKGWVTQTSFAARRLIAPIDRHRNKSCTTVAAAAAVFWLYNMGSRAAVARLITGQLLASSRRRFLRRDARPLLMRFRSCTDELAMIRRAAASASLYVLTSVCVRACVCSLRPVHAL